MGDARKLLILLQKIKLYLWSKGIVRLLGIFCELELCRTLDVCNIGTHHEVIGSSIGYKGTIAPGPTMQGTDVLFPQIGEIIGGSVREESYDKLMGEIKRRDMDMTHLWWYIDTRKWGSCPHAGFGLGFERLILFVTGMQNIRDVIPFPRTPKSAEF